MASELQSSESALGHAGSYVQDQLPSASEIEFLEYAVDEATKRHEEIRNIEQEVREVASIFVDLKHLVEEQQVSIDVIDANIASTRSRTEEGMRELEAAEKHQRSVRKRMCCTLIVLLIIIVIIVVVILFFKGKF